MGSVISEVLIDILFHSCCGWLGHWVVRIFTLGKVQMEYGDETPSSLAAIIGVLFLISAALLINAIW